MMNWILTFSLLVLLYVAYRMDRRCLISPIFIITGVMLASSVIVSINTNYWKYEISIYTYLLITGSIIAFMLGQCLGQHFSTGKVRLDARQTLSLRTFDAPNLLIYYGVLLFGTVTLLLYYRQQSSNAASVGMSGTIASIVQANRYHVGGGLHDSSIITLLVTLYSVMTYVFLFIYLYNRINLNIKRRGCLTLLITIIYFGCCALSTNRADIITGASYLIFLIIYLSYYKNGWTNPKKMNRKLVIAVVVVVMVMLILFRYLGTLTGKSGMYTIYDNISIYVGSSIVCLDKYITGTSNLPADFQVTLMSSLWSMLNKLGANIEIANYEWLHQYWNHAGSNVYTSLFPLYVKFGAVGTLVLQFLFGFSSGVAWRHLKKGLATWSFVVVFGSFFYFFTYYSIAERVFSQLFTLTSAIKIVATCFLISWLEKKSDIES